MMRLIYFEAVKILSRRYIFIVIAVFLLLGYLHICRPWDPIIRTNDTQNANISFAQMIQKMNTDQRFSLENYVKTTFDGELGSFDLAPPTGENYSLPGRYADTIADEYNGLLYFAYITGSRNEIIQARRDVVDRAFRLGLLALEEGDIYNVRRNANIITAYSHEPDLGVISTRRWDNFFSYELADILMITFVVLISSTVFTSEAPFKPILETSKKGLTHTFYAKIISTSLLSFIFTCIFWFIIFLLMQHNYNLAGLTYPVTIVPIMSLSFSQMAIYQYIILFIAFKAFGSVVAAVICCLISSLSRSSLIAFSSSVIFLILSFAYSAYISSKPHLSELFRLPDITIWLRANTYFSHYLTANVFSYPVLWALVHFIFWTCLAATLSAACCFIKNAKLPAYSKTLLNK
ncbi:MAG: hypothetical protein LBD23_02070 [Oscillospiraceae bacterium]|jgi:hypothetical protein|nr:hypothetical protein [Oscillospiraceae bacterium]